MGVPRPGKTTRGIVGPCLGDGPTPTKLGSIGLRLIVAPVSSPCRSCVRVSSCSWPVPGVILITLMAGANIGFGVPENLLDELPPDTTTSGPGFGKQILVFSTSFSCDFTSRFRRGGEGTTICRSDYSDFFSSPACLFI